MWFFKKRKTLGSSGAFQGFTDWHSHILPGVDDGVQTMEESLEILRLYEDLGVRSVWLTPHVMEDIPNSTSFLRERFDELRSAYKGPIELSLGSENMLDALFGERLEKNDLLPIGKNGDCLLVETSYFNPPVELQTILLRIKEKGCHPVLAHPERYVYMSKHDYLQLKSIGVKFQLNIFSLYGLYGNGVQRRSMSLQKNCMYDYIGTDLHNLETIIRMLKTNC